MYLELAGVHDYARVRVNGAIFEARAWPPYRWDITASLQPGNNDVQINVFVTPSGRGGFGGPPPAAAAAPGAPGAAGGGRGGRGGRGGQGAPGAPGTPGAAPVYGAVGGGGGRGAARRRRLRARPRTSTGRAEREDAG